MRTLPFTQLDVFTDRPFSGNPLAVFPEAEGLTAVQMQAIASEMNLSETVFILPPEGDGDARVRIFTPALELPFAGHPSVGTACELVRLRLVDVYQPVTRVVLELDVGPTVVEVAVREGQPVSGTVHQRPPVFGPPAPRGAVAAVLGLAVDDLHPEFDPVPVDTGLRYTIIPLASQRALARVSLQLDLAEEFERRHAEIYPCAFTGQDTPWIEARGLFPFAGITEDPATGSAAGPLAAYMAREGVLPMDEERVVLQGAQIGRPSFLTVAVSGAPDAITDVRVGGRVHPVLKGELFLPD
ncbi:MAG: PhzF family phenazine biosynthesis protein [Actinobacteria bacterium]|nr:PhzF family phenazine biosynthesis protein [Actinomycetota bacterium]